MKIQHIQEWIIEDFNPQQTQNLLALGWKWVDQTESLYGHFSTRNKTVLDKTIKELEVKR